MMDLQAAFDAIPAHADQPMTVTAEADRVILVGTLDRRSARMVGMDQVHGGVIAALLDSATTFAAVVASGVPCATVDIRVDYLRPLPLGEVRVVANVVRQGRRISRSAATMTDADGRVVATAVATLAL